MINAGWSNIPFRKEIAGKTSLQKTMNGMNVNLGDIYKYLEISEKELQNILVM